MKQLIFILTLIVTYNVSYSQIIGTNEYTKSLNVNMSTPLEITDLDGNSLNKTSIYKIQLVTRNTGTKTGASYLAWSLNGTWRIRAVGISGDTSNHPQLIIDNDILKVATLHANTYPIRVFVKEIISEENDVEPYIFGADFQWQRNRTNLYYTDGNVGIGTDDPSEKLEIEGSLLLNSDSYVSYAIERGNGAKSIFGITSTTHDGFLSSSGNLKFLTNNDDRGNFITSMFINDQGNVGIGTNDPEHKLHVQMTAGTKFKTYDYGVETVVNATGGWARAFRIRNENDDVTAAFGAHNGNAYIATGFDGISNTTGHTNKKLIVKTNGNVGIGIDNPLQKLVVSGNAIFDNGGIHTTVQFGNEKNDKIIADNSTNDYYGGGYFFRVHDDSLPNDYRDAMMISKTGQIGIGTRTMGTHNLAVEGSIGAREIKVEGNGWSDFVFENDYNLPTLKEVEEHINEKGHLKDIPSAADVAKDGINLGEMNSKLLQKIEELTLYTIAQEKRLLQMEERLNKLEK